MSHKSEIIEIRFVMNNYFIVFQSVAAAVAFAYSTVLLLKYQLIIMVSSYLVN